MSLTRVEIQDWASAYIEAQQLSNPADIDDPLWWSIDRFMNCLSPEQAEDAWSTILEVLGRKPPDDVLGILAAGPLEDLIESWGPMFIDRIEVEARDNPNFHQLLRGVWPSSTPEVWQRIEAVRGAE